MSSPYCSPTLPLSVFCSEVREESEVVSYDFVYVFGQRLKVSDYKEDKTQKDIYFISTLEGYKDVEGTKIKVFYPIDGVSRVQKLQMQTQEGSNVSVVGIVGNFDDAQTGVKKIFSDNEFKEKLKERGYELSSANSINWGRLLPQIVYYVSSYAEHPRNRSYQSPSSYYL